jgi:hypothetical protein
LTAKNAKHAKELLPHCSWLRYPSAEFADQPSQHRQRHSGSKEQMTAKRAKAAKDPVLEPFAGLAFLAV